jgi:ComF family protein
VKKFYNRLKFNHASRLSWLHHYLSLDLPCLLCGSLVLKEYKSSSNSQGSLCPGCENSLPWYLSPRCPQCALPTSSGTICGICLQHPPAFDRTLAAFRYAYPLDRLLQQFKYHQQLPLGKSLAEIMLPKLPPLIKNDRPEIMLAMPMHLLRIKQRGFNHALELAKHFHQALHIPLEIEGCLRVVDTPTQAGMDMKTRTRNLRNAFVSETHWEGKHVMVVDDVMTTGASMHAVAKVLKQSGAGKVTALVFARTLKDTEN